VLLHRRLRAAQDLSSAGTEWAWSHEPARTTQSSDYARRGFFQGVTGRGFNSRRLHFPGRWRLSPAACFCWVNQARISDPSSSSGIAFPTCRRWAYTQTTAGTWDQETRRGSPDLRVRPLCVHPQQPVPLGRRRHPSRACPGGAKDISRGSSEANTPRADERPAPAGDGADSIAWSTLRSHNRRG
jgi:hypothetical protein